VDIVSAKKQLDAYLTRVEEMIEQARWDPNISIRDIIRVLGNFESALTDLTIMVVSSSSMRSVSLFPTFEQKESMVKSTLESLKKSLSERNLTRAKTLLEILRTRLYSYVRTLAFVLHSTERVPEAAVEAITGMIKIPEGLSINAGRVYSYLRKNYEADPMEIAERLNMDTKEVAEAIEELRRLGYVDTYMRGRMMMVRLRGI